jgi:hypothetical protein
MAKVKILTGKYKGKYLEFIGLSNWFRNNYTPYSIITASNVYNALYVVVKSDYGKLIWYLRNNVDLHDTFDKSNPSSLRAEPVDKVLDNIIIHFNTTFSVVGFSQPHMTFVSTEKRRLNVIFHSDCVSLVEASHLNRYLYTFPMSYVKAIVHNYKKS